MPRDFKLYIEDVADAIARIQRYTARLSFQQFAGDEKTLDAVVPNLEVIGEAMKKLAGSADFCLPESLRLVQTNNSRHGMLLWRPGSVWSNAPKGMDRVIRNPKSAISGVIWNLKSGIQILPRAAARSKSSARFREQESADGALSPQPSPRGREPVLSVEKEWPRYEAGRGGQWVAYSPSRSSEPRVPNRRY